MPCSWNSSLKESELPFLALQSWLTSFQSRHYSKLPLTFFFHHSSVLCLCHSSPFSLVLHRLDNPLSLRLGVKEFCKLLHDLRPSPQALFSVSSGILQQWINKQLHQSVSSGLWMLTVKYFQRLCMSLGQYINSGSSHPGRISIDTAKDLKSKVILEMQFVFALFVEGNSCLCLSDDFA